MASTTTTTATGMTVDIDDLLTTYLGLLDTYTTLRSKLTALQASTSLSLARASLTTPHALGYTPGNNAHLRAAVRLHVSPPSEPTSHDDGAGDEEGEEVFGLVPVDARPSPKTEDGDEDTAHKEDDGEDDDADAVTADTDAETEPTSTSTPTPLTAQKTPPLLPPGFGVLAPPSLREAQASATEAVCVIAQLAGVEIRMRAVEVEVRRARKRAMKAEKGR
ncbi:hypothetical protein VE03_02393 [Pseudogymnoascus sp. 23342-1-I1]|nr:hypothetical protein VE03_02393 [Pseudogymnoascus sp. 23342-1-I1]